MRLRIGVLISKPLDLEHRSRDEGRDNEEGQNGREGPVLYSGIHPNQRDQEQRWNAKRDRGKDVDWVR